MQLTLGLWKQSRYGWVAFTLIAWAACGGAATSHAQEAPTNSRSQMVAQTVFGILSYSRWPKVLSTVRLCVLGSTNYADGLFKGGKISAQREVQTQRLTVNEPQLLAKCHAVYAGDVSEEDWRSLLLRAADQSLLTISEDKALCVIGGMFCLDVQDAGVAFEVNLDSVARSGVKVNPRVLQLGRRKGAQ